VRLSPGGGVFHLSNLLILWDVDGTLVRCGPIGRQAIERAARRALDHRVDWTDDDVPQVRMSGGTDPGILLELLAHGGVDEDEIDGVLAEALVHLENELAAGAHHITLEGEVLPGVTQAVTRLYQAPGVIQSVLTGNIASNAAVKVGAFGLDTWLDLEIGAYGSDHVDRNRLVPLAVERATAKHGRAFRPTDVWVVGDTPRDLACAAAAEARCLLVATGGHPIDELEGLGADAVLSDLSDTDRVAGLLLGTGSLGRHIP
jgi:phosphoglycolate phosphatase